MVSSYESPTQLDPHTRLASAVQHQVQIGVGEPAGQLGHAAEHALASAGKLLRPELILEACRAVGGDPDCVLPAAVGTELGHVASLVHDDVIDGDCVRRGRPAVHAAFGVPLAILTGDLLVFQMFSCYTESLEAGVSAKRVLKAIRILSQTCIDVCRGQALEAECAGAAHVSEASYFEIIRLKTAGVCGAATEIGATLGGGNSHVVNALRGYGEAVGMAFQIVDDLLEYVGDADRLGRPLDSDDRNGRMTLPLIYALEDGSETRIAVERLLRKRAEGHASLVDLLDRTGMLARTRETAERFTRLAGHHLAMLPRSDARDRLQACAADLLDRDR